ncbi:MAG: alcohol dehydrogenase [Deltaproteobacteria bacterium SG8_13]|nr:MAG: alcohol dehydrogenase [Deltaproteobacteria bacterium SG8_13]
MNTIQAAVMARAGGGIELRIDEFPAPDLQPGAVLLKTIYSEVCGTDVHLMHGRLDQVPYPIIPGHVSVGKIEEIAGAVTDIHGRRFRSGDTVTFLDVHETCNACWHCLVAKASTRCPHRKVYGITYSAREGLLGGWSQRIYLKPGVKIVALPEGLTAEDFIAGGCGAPTGLHAVERAAVRLNDFVVVQGGGPVGLSAALFSLLGGAGAVVVVDPAPSRITAARTLGVDFTVDAASPAERISAVMDLTGGRGADVTIEASGNPGAVVEGLQMTRDNGTYAIAGQYTDAGDMTLNPHRHINKKHIDIRGVWGTDFSHLYKAVQLMARHMDRYPLKRMISKVYPLKEAEAALSDVEHRRVVKAVIAPNQDR